MPGHRVPPSTRPLAFAEGELFLHLLYLAQKVYASDLQSVLILVAVNDATMRPYMTDPNLDRELLTRPELPNNTHGAISRLMIADKIGLPRETVRRKVKQLIASGFLMELPDGRVRMRALVGDKAVQAALKEGHSAVLAYLQRIDQFGGVE